MKTEFVNAQQAFEVLYEEIMQAGTEFDSTKAIFNRGFLIQNPLDCEIKTPWRKWNKDYAEYEWQWYFSGNPNAEEIAKRAKIWANMMDENGNVNSNYGYQWNRNNQLDKVIEMLIKNPDTRKASISLYDGKEIDLYSKDTICTYAIHFTVVNKSYLNMTVMMRSNDLVYGFCNDQYCFSQLLKHVCMETGYYAGTYYHFAVNLHIYPRHFEMRKNYRPHPSEIPFKHIMAAYMA